MLNRNTTLYGILALVLSNPVYAALDCTSHPTCESLGYSKSDTANCADGGYLSCPYDTSYKKCVQVMTYANDPCYGFSLTSCPDNASCYKCETETATMYTFNGCNEGYSVNESNTGCNINCTYADEAACESANANADCTDVNGCYELTGCQEGYTLNSAGTGCELACTYADEAECEEAYSHSECTKVDGCYEPTGCKVPYVSSCDNGSELAEPDGNNCGYCDCPEGTRHFDGIDFCVPVFVNCEQAGLVTPTTLAEKLICGEGIIVIRDVLGREMKCYEEACSYYTYETTCEVGADLTTGQLRRDLITYRYKYVWNGTQFVQDGPPTLNNISSGSGFCTGYPKTMDGEASMGGGGGSTAACTNQKKTALDLLDQTYTSKIETLQRETLINAGIYYMDNTSCVDYENYRKAGSY